MSRRVVVLLLAFFILQTAASQKRRLCGTRLWKAVLAICKSTTIFTDVDLPVDSPRSIVEECCRNQCTHEQILSYCDDKQIDKLEIDKP